MSGEVELLERELARWLSAAGAVATGFGRGALALALETIGVEQADVLVPDFICSQVPAAVRWANGRPVPYPVSRDLTVDPARFHEALTPKTKAAIVPHYFGRALPQTEELAALCHERAVPLVENCALALGARRGDRLAGTFGDAAVFSFSKSDWCFGGGTAVFHHAKWNEWARNLSTRRMRRARRLNFCYGLLRRADWEANRPTRARWVELAGRSIERAASVAVPAFRGGNFFDAGTLDAAMPGFAARRARQILRGLPTAILAQRRICGEAASALHNSTGLCRPFRALEPGDAGSFFLLWAEKGSAAELRQRAARAGLTLRLCWPAYEQLWTEPSESVRALADRLLILEVHPRSSPRDVRALWEGLQKL